VDVTTL